VANFLPIKAFQSLYGSFSELLTPEGIANFQERIENEGETVFNEKGFSAEEKKGFILSLNNPKIILFHSWVEQNSVLNTLLTQGELSHFSDTSKHLQHQYAEEFKSFISPFLSEILLKFSGTTVFTERLNALSFCELLDKKHNAVVESQLFSPLLKEVKITTDSCKEITDEKDLIDRVTPLCKQELIECVNYLSRASYALKLEYVDAVLSVLKYKSCTPRFANWVLKELRNVQLNTEHEHKITDLIRDLKKGDLTVRNHGKEKRIIKASTVLTVLSVFLLAGTVFWFVKYKPFADIEEEEFSNETSFMQFSKDERKKIDSLLLVMNGNVKDDQLKIDHGTTLIGESDVLTLRKDFKNKLFQEIHDDFALDAEQRSFFSDSCETAISFQQIEGTKTIQSKKGSTEAMLKNESDYDVILVIATDQKKGKVYTTLIKSGKTISFELERNDVLFLVAGNDLNTYQWNEAENEQMPSKHFKSSFCEIDDNYLRSISTVYRMNNPDLSKVKFLLTGNKGAYFSLIDLHSVLIEI